MNPVLSGSASLTPTRIRLALLALALGSFGVGTTEFVTMGLLPNMAEDLLPAVWAASTEKAIAQSGWLITAYALGVVIGAPTIAALAARFPRRRVLTGLGIGFTIATIATAALPSFGLILASRFIAGLPHGAYFGIAALVASSIMGPQKRARGVAFVLAGLTIANVVGVPLATWVGQGLGWRAAFVIVALIFAFATASVWLAVPEQPGDPQQTLRRELLVFTRPQVWFALGIGSIGFGGFFAAYSYIAPIVQHVVGLPAHTVPLFLIVTGIGMTIGNLAAGRIADASVRGALYFCASMLLCSLLGLALTATWWPALALFVFGFGAAAGGVGPSIQTRLMDVAHDSQSIAAALNHSALNLGNAIGAFFGSVVIAAGFGYIAPVWVGVLLATGGMLMITLSYAVERRTTSRNPGMSALVDDDAVEKGALTQSNLRSDVNSV